MKSRIAVILVFISGLIIGAVGNDFYMRHRFHKMHRFPPEKKGDFIVYTMQRELGLSDDQVQKIRPIVQSSTKKIQELREHFHPEINKIIEESFSLIKKELDETQKQKLDEMFQKMRKRPPPFPF